MISLQKQLQISEEKYEKTLRKRHYNRFKKGPCFYIISDTDSVTTKYKVGIDNEDINVRLQTYRTSIPSTKLEYLVYTKSNKLLEDCILQKFSNNREYINREWIYRVEINQLINSITALIGFLEINATIEISIDQYNIHLVAIEI